MARRRYSLRVTELGILSESVGSFNRLDSVNKRLDEILEDRRSATCDDWLYILDHHTNKRIREEGRGKNKGKRIPAIVRTS